MKLWNVFKDDDYKMMAEIISNNGGSEGFNFAIISAFEKWHEEVEEAEKKLQKFREAYSKEQSKENQRKVDILRDELFDIQRTRKKVCMVLNYIDISIEDAEKMVSAILIKMVSKNYEWIPLLRKTVWADNAFVMRNLIASQNIMLEAIGDKLANNSEFMLELVSTYVVPGQMWQGYVKIGYDLKYDMEFVLRFIRVIVKKYRDSENCSTLTDSEISKILKAIYGIPLANNDFLGYNQYFWREFNHLGFDAHTPCLYEKPIIKEAKRLAANPNLITTEYNDNYILMLNVIEINPGLYILASERLKMQENFQKEAIELGVSEEIIDAEKDKIIKQNEESRLEKRRYNVKRKMEISISLYGPNSSNYALVEKYLNETLSIVDFCSQNNIDEDEFKKIYSMVTENNQEIAEKREKKVKMIRASWAKNVKGVSDRIEAEEVYIYELAKDVRLAYTPIDFVRMADNKLLVSENIIKAILSEKLSMCDFVRLFSKEYNYAKTIKAVKEFLDFVAKECPELAGAGKPIHKARMVINKLKKYEKEYRKEEFVNTKRGFLDKDGNTSFVEITDAKLEQVKSYLKAIDEFICNKTVDDTIRKFLVESWAA